jgi:hypothetical protein
VNASTVARVTFATERWLPTHPFLGVPRLGCAAR